MEVLKVKKKKKITEQSTNYIVPKTSKSKDIMQRASSVI